MFLLNSHPQNFAREPVIIQPCLNRAVWHYYTSFIVDLTTDKSDSACYPQRQVISNQQSFWFPGRSMMSACWTAGRCGWSLEKQAGL